MSFLHDSGPRNPNSSTNVSKTSSSKVLPFAICVQAVRRDLVAQPVVGSHDQAPRILVVELLHLGHGLLGHVRPVEHPDRAVLEVVDVVDLGDLLVVDAVDDRLVRVLAARAGTVLYLKPASSSGTCVRPWSLVFWYVHPAALIVATAPSALSASSPPPDRAKKPTTSASITNPDAPITYRIFLFRASSRGVARCLGAWTARRGGGGVLTFLAISRGDGSYDGPRSAWFILLCGRQRSEER